MTLNCNNISLKNHFTSTNTVKKFRKQLHNYKYGESLDFHNNNQNTNTSNKTTPNTPDITTSKITTTTIPNISNELCTIRTLQRYEKEFKVRYVIIDKSLGVGIVLDPLFIKICKIE